jgi:hypothetical protein
MKTKISSGLRILKQEGLNNFLFSFFVVYGMRLMPEKMYLRLLFRIKVGYKPNLRHPKTFNEKLNWLKLYNRKPEYTMMVDKYAVKRYVEEKIGAQYVVPLYGVWEKAEDIDWDKLPEKFVLKTNHNSCYNLVCRDKSTIDKPTASKEMNHSLAKNLYYNLGEWPYKNVPPRIIAEKLLESKERDNNQPLIDYKFWCFNGKPTFMYFSIKGDDCYENFYDMEFNFVGINHGWPRHEPEFEKPVSWEKMKKLATILSKDIPFVRVDFYEIDGHPYFGELTFFDWAGLLPFDSYETDLKLGEYIQLPKDVVK